MKYLVTLTNTFIGQSDHYITYTESKFDNNLFSAIDKEYLYLYNDNYYFHYDCYEKSLEEYLLDMISSIEEWTDEIEKQFGNNLSIIYESSSN